MYKQLLAWYLRRARGNLTQLIYLTAICGWPLLAGDQMRVFSIISSMTLGYAAIQGSFSWTGKGESELPFLFSRAVERGTALSARLSASAVVGLILALPYALYTAFRAPTLINQETILICLACFALGAIGSAINQLSFARPSAGIGWFEGIYYGSQLLLVGAMATYIPWRSSLTLFLAELALLVSMAVLSAWYCRRRWRKEDLGLEKRGSKKETIMETTRKIPTRLHLWDRHLLRVVVGILVNLIPLFMLLKVSYLSDSIPTSLMFYWTSWLLSFSSGWTRGPSGQGASQVVYMASRPVPRKKLLWSRVRSGLAVQGILFSVLISVVMIFNRWDEQIQMIVASNSPYRFIPHWAGISLLEWWHLAIALGCSAAGVLCREIRMTAGNRSWYRNLTSTPYVLSQWPIIFMAILLLPAFLSETSSYSHATFSLSLGVQTALEHSLILPAILLFYVWYAGKSWKSWDIPG